MIESLISKGVDVNEYGTIISGDLNFDNIDILPINCALIKNNKNLVENLIKHGAELNNLDAPLPLIYAIEEDNIEIVDLLINFGAKVNIVFRDLQRKKWTPLTYAINKNNEKIK